jgi:hypothetical protein
MTRSMVLVVGLVCWAASALRGVSNVPCGFESGMQCNYNKECSSRNCEAPNSKSCLRHLLDGTYDCDDHKDCISEQCNFNMFKYETCEPKLDAGASCKQVVDCKSSYCHSSVCTAKLDNGSFVLFE